MEGIFFDGQIFDAYTFVSDLIRSAKKSIVLFDNYVDDTVLAMLDKRCEKVSATIYTQKIKQQLSLDIEKHNAQYQPIEVKPFDGFRVVASGYLGTGCAVGTAAWNPDIQVGDNYKRNRYSVGAEYKTAPYTGSKYKEARPASVRAEWLGGQDGDVGSRGGYVTTSIPVVETTTGFRPRCRWRFNESTVNCKQNKDYDYKSFIDGYFPGRDGRCGCLFTQAGQKC